MFTLGTRPPKKCVSDPLALFSVSRSSSFIRRVLPVGQERTLRQHAVSRGASRGRFFLSSGTTWPAPVRIEPDTHAAPPTFPCLSNTLAIKALISLRRTADNFDIYAKPHHPKSQH